MIKKEAARQLEVESKPGDASAEDYKPLPSGPADSHVEKVPLLKNIYWKELSLLVYIWVGFLLVQIAKGTWRIGIAPYNPLGRGFFCGKAVIESVPANSFLTFQPRFQGENFDKNKIFYSRLVKLAEKHECADVHLHNLLLHGFFIKEMMWYPSLTYFKTCSVQYWILNFLQVPIAISVALFEAICLYKGTRVIGSKGKEITSWKVHQICLYCSCGIIAGMVGGLLGLGGGFILGPVFLELGIPPEVASATSTFSMLFSSSMSVVQYYMLDRFPVPYGGVGIENMIEKMENHEYMGFENLCDHS